MPDTSYGTFTKDGFTRTASTVEAAVRFRFEGWQSVPDAADVFDPARHSVEDVKAYLAGADENERARVVDVERSGKARATLLD